MKRVPLLAGVALLVLAAVRLIAQQSPPTRLALELQDYAALPLTADNTNTSTRAQLARVNSPSDRGRGRGCPRSCPRRVRAGRPGFELVITVEFTSELEED